MQVTVVHNPTAGRGAPSADELTGLLKACGYTFRYQSSKDPEFPSALAEPTDLVAVAGGDSTVAKVLANLPNRNVPVAVLPLGTASNVARSLGIGGALREIAEGWRNAQIRPFDIGVACGPWGRRPFIEAVGIGVLARATAQISAADVPSADKMRSGRDVLRRVLTEVEPERLHIAVDRRALPDDLLLVEVMNNGYAGPNLHLAPSADPGDGVLDVAYVRAGRRADMLAWLGAEDSGPPPVEVQREREVSVDWNGTPLRFDDDFAPRPEHTATIVIELEAEAVRMLVPK